MESGAHTSHAPGGRPPHREPVRFPAAVASPRWGALAFLTFRRTDHDHDQVRKRIAHPEVCRQADAAEAGPGRPDPARISSRFGGTPRGGGIIEGIMGGITPGGINPYNFTMPFAGGDDV